jgi:hypothetical protein
MILFPQDDLRNWCGAYPPSVVAKQFTKLAILWKEGLEGFRAAGPRDLAIAETCWRHFQSTAHQVEFYILREKLARGAAARDRMREIVRAELALARDQYLTARRHSEIGFEASNHYYYTPLDLVEKVINCRHVLDEIDRP